MAENRDQKLAFYAKELCEEMMAKVRRSNAAPLGCLLICSRIEASAVNNNGVRGQLTVGFIVDARIPNAELVMLDAAQTGIESLLEKIEESEQCLK